MTQIILSSPYQEPKSHHAPHQSRDPRFHEPDPCHHLNFHIRYIHEGAEKCYFPDFLVRWADGSHLVIETKNKERAAEFRKHGEAERWAKATGWEFHVCRGRGRGEKGYCRSRQELLNLRHT